MKRRARTRVVGQRKRVRRNSYLNNQGLLMKKRAANNYNSGGGELKFFDTSKASTTVASTGTILNSTLNQVRLGTGDNNRIGRKIVVRSLHMRGFSFVEEELAATDLNNTSERTRIIVYLDKQCNGAAATAGDILQATVGINSFNNLDNAGRFVILMDKMIDMHPRFSTQVGATPTFAVGEQQISWFFNKRGLNIPIEFKADAGAITDVASNNFGVLALSNDGTAEVDYFARIRYTDN